MHVNVCVIGLDRVSTSLALALKRYQNQSKAQHTFTIIGTDPLAQPMKAAQKLGALDNFDIKLLKAVENADLIIMNAPLGQVEEKYIALGSELKSGAVVLDLTPFKQPVIEWAGEHFPKNKQGMPLAYVVGITPIINAKGLYNADNSPDAATADLFEEAEFLVAPDAKCPSEAITLAEDVIRLVGGQPRFMDPVEHDGLIAATEGLPNLLGSAVFYYLQQSEGWPELRRMVNPSLALAMQSLRTQKPEDGFALFSRNRENLVRHLEGLIGVLDEIRDTLVENDPERLEVYLGRVAKEWEKWDIKRHSGRWDETPKIEALAGPLGSMGFLSPKRRKRSEDEDEDE